jgi:hypothetical protein
MPFNAVAYSLIYLPFAQPCYVCLRVIFIDPIVGIRAVHELCYGKTTTLE